jgi:DNA-binding MurR/RpiR family transcriptional regulator
MNAEAKIAKIIETIEAGKTVYFTTSMRSYAVTMKTLTKFRKLGYDLFKAQGNSMMMMVGKSYLCIDYCQITHN